MFKISNPNKIPCSVSFAIAAADAMMGGKSEASDPGDAEDLAAYTVEPSGFDIEPHGQKQVCVYFKPTGMRKYSAQFVATVADGENDPATGSLKFGRRDAARCRASRWSRHWSGRRRARQ